jgi:hypothetical protein
MIIITMPFIVVGARISGSGFLHLTESRLEQFGVSIGFLLPLMNIIGDLV